MELQGTIIQVLPLQEGQGKQSGKAWKKQEYILETPGQYPKKVCFNLWGDAVDRFMIKEGEELTIQVDIESREYNGRWYTDVRAWRVDRGFVSMQPAITPPSVAPTANFPQTAQPASAPTDDLPSDGLPF